MYICFELFFIFQIITPQLIFLGKNVWISRLSVIKTSSAKTLMRRLENHGVYNGRVCTITITMEAKYRSINMDDTVDLYYHMISLP